METFAKVTSLSSIALWVGGTVAGWAFGFLPAMIVITNAFCCSGDARPNFATEVCLIILLFGTMLFISAFIIAGSQARSMLNVLGENEGKWLWFSALAIFLGWLLGWVATYPFLSSGDDDKVETWLQAGVVVGSVIGLFTGITQLLLMRRLHFARIWWPGVSILGWTSASALYWLVYGWAGGPFEPTYVNYEGTQWAKYARAPGAFDAMLLGWFIGGLALALITGAGMLIILRTAKPNRQLTTDN